jgi:pantothenate synthetase
VRSSCAQSCQRLFAQGERSVGALRAEVERVIAAEPRAKLQYVAVTSSSAIELPQEAVAAPGAMVSIAVGFSQTRLIDNVLL